MPPSRSLALTKRLVDVAVAGFLLLVSAPLLLVIAVLIKATSAGPVLFRQERLGRNGRRFQLYKLRTMHTDAEDLLRTRLELHSRYIAGGYKIPDGEDPRITAVGRFLRRTGIDELAQLLNVLRGEMSLVGPRPIVPAEVLRYPEFSANVRYVRPGITGSWQVQRQGGVDYERRSELDRTYAATCSLRGDAVILEQTMIVLLRGLRPARNESMDHLERADAGCSAPAMSSAPVPPLRTSEPSTATNLSDSPRS